MIELRYNEARRKYELFIDDVLMTEAQVDNPDELENTDKVGRPADNDILEIGSFDPSTINKLISFRCIDFPEKAYFLSLYTSLDWARELSRVVIRVMLKGNHIGFFVGNNLTDWKSPFTYAEYVTAFAKLYQETQQLPMDAQISERAGLLIIEFPDISTDSVIASEISRYTSELRTIHEKVVTSLITNAEESVIVSFEFPKEINIACEQYLIYFVQFLRDLGVEATSELKHIAGQVLFTVTPVDKHDALDKIRAALDLYLDLPSARNLQTDKEIAILRLNANVDHLKSELALTQAMLQAKDATIQAQQISISYQQQVINANVINESVIDIKPETEDKEEILGGTVAIKVYEGKGFDINLPLLFRTLRDLFSKKG